MSAEDESEWHLGWMKRNEANNGVDIATVRSLSMAEHERFNAVRLRLESLNLPAMFSVLSLAFEELRLSLAKATGNPSRDLREPATLYTLQYRFTAALAAFSYYRSDIEKVAGELGLPELARVRVDFANASAQDRHWRLLAQLRNLDQHHPSALRHLSFHAEAGKDGADDIFAILIDIGSLIKHAKEVSEPRFFKQWDQLEALWQGHPSKVALTEVVGRALDRNYAIMTDCILAVETQLRDDIFTYLGLAKEVETLGAGIVVRIDQESDLSLQHTSLDPRVAGVVALSINEARKNRGLPPRFQVALNGNKFTFTEFTEQ